ncbi:MAG: zinc ABC transporter substrate-binding protein [Alphaproteobacteria bacterium]
MRRLFAPALAGALALTAAAAQAEPPKVVASIAPLHALVAGVMEGVGTPALLVPAGASPHTYSMRPSEARLLNEAGVVFWIGDEMETFLVKPVAALGGKARSVELAEAPGVTLLPYREGGVWETHAHDKKGHGHDRKAGHSHDHGKKDHGKKHAHSGHDHGKKGHDHDKKAGHAHGHDHAHGTHDMHVWLDPANARAIVQHVATVLGEADGANAAAYEANAERTIGRLDELDAELRAKLEPVRAAPFIVFHDAYQYFERAYGLSAAGSVTISPEHAPGARRLSEIRTRIADSGARCVFSEPQFDAGLVATVAEGTPARIAELDPLGVGVEPGPDLYFTVLRSLGSAIGDCLGAAG